MAKQETRRTSPGRGRAPEGRAERPTGTDVGGAYTKLFEGWTAFYRDVGDRLTQNAAKQQKAYEELFNRWNTFTGSAAKIWTDVGADERMREAFDVWRNYGNRLGGRLARATTEGLKGYQDVTGSLDRYATRVADIGRQAMGGKIEAFRAEDVYETWLDVLGRFGHQLDRSAEMNREELEDLSKTWLEFEGRMDTFVSEWAGKEGPYTEFVDLWAKESKAVGETLAIFVKGHDHDYEEMRKAWAEHFLKMQTDMAELAKAIGVSYENMYRRFLEEGATALSDLPIFPYWGQKAGDETVRDLRHRIEELERKGKTS